MKPLTTLHLKLALLGVVRIDDEVHRARQSQRQLHHVQDGFVFVQPHVVIGDGHCLESHRLGVLEEGVRSPHVLQPLHFEQAVFGGHILGQSKAVVFPGLGEENVSCVGLWSEGMDKSMQIGQKSV